MTLLPILSTIKRRWSSERGAVLVEAALAVPILLFVILGAVEAGMAWEAKSATTSGVRTGLLRAASIGDQPETDLRILQSIVGEIGAENVENLEWVVIFDATDPDHATTIENCRLAVAGGGIFGTCNAYGSGTQFADVVAGTLTQADFDDGGGVSGSTYTCDVTKVDSNWCAPGRLVNGDIQVGVALKYTHDWFTGILPGDGVDFEDYSTSSTFIGEGSNISASTPVTPPSSTVYDSGSFDGPLNVGDVTWTGASDSDIITPPADSTRNFLGRFGTNDSIDLTISNLPAHTMVCVTFDLYAIGSWDGNNGWGPDEFGVDVDGTNQYMKPVHNQGDTAVDETESDSLGYGTGTWGEAVIPVTVCDTAHTANTVTFTFFSNFTESLSNESWGIDNVVVDYY
ncbi:MAG: TadE/TadG family type IV pilus assembly protein [Acidimicrobiia bacterium]|nr:TadE/TadG family type IV pilus assembly protein [Acidimicrobiia bacterium]